MINILFADDDKNDCFFFKKALDALPVQTELTVVRTGDQLLKNLSENKNHLPDLVFLDLHMPGKNGVDCLLEIKSNPQLNSIPIIIYSTSMEEPVANFLFENGAHYYIKKRDYLGLKKVLQYIVDLYSHKNFHRPSKEKFVLDAMETKIAF